MDYFYCVGFCAINKTWGKPNDPFVFYKLASLHPGTELSRKTLRFKCSIFLKMGCFVENGMLLFVELVVDLSRVVGA